MRGFRNILVDYVAALRTGRPGEEPRLQVDQGSTGFFAGREFRTFRRLNIGNGQSEVIEAVVPVNVILTGLKLSVQDGWADVETIVGGTPGGTFGTPLPIFNRNNMTEVPTPVYTAQVTLATGGTHTGGTILDVISARSAGSTAQASSVGDALSDERGIGPGTYYFRVANVGSGDVDGVFSARWEERPSA